MRKLVLAATALVGTMGIALANNIVFIDISNGGTAKTLTITQDMTNADNTISGLLNGTGSLTVRGHWNVIAISQSGSNNKLYGAVSSATVGDLNANYNGGRNTHGLTIGNANAPDAPNITVNVTNSGANTNTITDVINVTAAGLTYQLSLNGTGNTLANTVAANGATFITVNVGGSTNTITSNLNGGATSFNLTLDSGANNTVTNSVHATGPLVMTQGVHGSSNTAQTTVGDITPVLSYQEALSLSGDTNLVVSSTNGGGGKAIDVTLASSGSTANTSLTGTGIQSSSLLGDAGTVVDFSLTAPAQNSSSNIILSNVIGTGGIPAVVRVTQDTAANNATINFTIAGGPFTMGQALHGGTIGASVTQVTANATLTGSFTGGANGYTVSISQ